VGTSEIDLCRWGMLDFEPCARSPRIIGGGGGGFGTEIEIARVGARRGEEEVIMKY
jgi:hypothetical protein